MKRLLTLWLLAALPLTGQEKGTITGRLSDLAVIHI